MHVPTIDIAPFLDGSARAAVEPRREFRRLFCVSHAATAVCVRRVGRRPRRYQLVQE